MPEHWILWQVVYWLFVQENLPNASANFRHKRKNIQAPLRWAVLPRRTI